MGVFSDNPNPAPFQTGPIKPLPTPGVPAGPPAAPNKPMDIRAQANRAKQQGTQRQMMWQQMMSGTARSASHKLVQNRDAIDRLVDRMLYGSAP